MDRLKAIKEILVEKVEAQMCHLECVDTKELGEVIDMIKDLEEAIYYCTITDAMHQRSYPEPMKDKYRRISHDGGHYEGRSRSRTHDRLHPDGGHDVKDEHETVGEGSWGERERDPREGISSHQRRMYMEAKEMHHGKAKQLQELEKYMKDLSGDMVEMIEDASPEEKQYLANRLSALASKISKLEQ